VVSFRALRFRPRPREKASGFGWGLFLCHGGSACIGRRVYNQRLIIKCHLLRSGWLKYFRPSRSSFLVNGWIFHAATLNSFEKDIRRCSEIVQLNCRAERSASEAQGIPLGSSPRAPFDDHGKTEREELVREPPLQSLDLHSTVFIIVVKCKSLHPFVGGKTHGSEPPFKRTAKGGLAGARQSAQDD
jgi:hypothetical protein